MPASVGSEKETHDLRTRTLTNKYGAIQLGQFNTFNWVESILKLELLNIGLILVQ